jgi:hypothetical protein
MHRAAVSGSFGLSALARPFRHGATKRKRHSLARARATKFPPNPTRTEPHKRLPHTISHGRKPHEKALARTHAHERKRSALGT